MFVIAKVRLGGDTKKINTKTGTLMRTAWGFADVDSESGLMLGIVAFGNLSEELAKYHQGDSVRVSGNFKANDYQAKDGTEKKGWQIICDGIAGIKSAKAKYSAPRPKADPVEQQQKNAATQRFNSPPDFDDALKF